MNATPADAIESSAGRVTLPPWAFLETLPAALEAGIDRVAAFRDALGAGDRILRQRFEPLFFLFGHYLLFHLFLPAFFRVITYYETRMITINL